MAEVCEHLEQARLVTLVGPGDIGKTRLALVVGRPITRSGLEVAVVVLAPVWRRSPGRPRPAARHGQTGTSSVSRRPPDWARLWMLVDWWCDPRPLPAPRDHVDPLRRLRRLLLQAELGWRADRLVAAMLASAVVFGLLAYQFLGCRACLPRCPASQESLILPV